MMSMPIFGYAEDFYDEELSLDVAFQIINILRDVGEDAVERGCMYLPRQADQVAMANVAKIVRRSNYTANHDTIC